jgi:glyoxylase-like metal-dependent hydrolase (beta-lactamase superfamily II)
VPLDNLIGFEVIKTPGHTAGGICLLLKDGMILFSGDTLFDDGQGRTDLYSSDPVAMKNSLKLKKEM